MKKSLYIAIILFALCGCRQQEVKMPVHECAMIPDGGRASACSCVLNGKAYVFAGRDSAGTYLKDLWQYDPLTDTWTDLGKTPLPKRVNATMTACGDKIYVGLGYSALRAYNDKYYRHDWWEYNPANNQWKQLSDYPSDNTVDAHAYCIDNSIYVLYGCGHVQQNEVWQYNILTDEWTLFPEANNPANRAFGCAGGVVDGVLYFGLGFNGDNLRKWYSVLLPENRWQRCASIPGKGREFSASAATDKYVYLFGGRYFGGDMTGGEVFDTWLRYSPTSDSWERCGIMPCGRAENQVAFAIGNKVYFGLGEDALGKVINKLYCVEQ